MGQFYPQRTARQNGPRLVAGPPQRQVAGRERQAALDRIFHEFILPLMADAQILGFGGDGEKAGEPKAKKPPKAPQDRKHQFAIWYVFVAFLGVMLIQYVWLAYTQVETIPYSQFEQLLSENKIAEVMVGAESIQGTLKQPLPDGRKLFYTVRVDPQLADKLKERGVTVAGAPSNNILSTILSWALPIFIFYLIWTYGVRHMAEQQGLGGLMAI